MFAINRGMFNNASAWHAAQVMAHSTSDVNMILILIVLVPGHCLRFTYE